MLKGKRYAGVFATISVCKVIRCLGPPGCEASSSLWRKLFGAEASLDAVNRISSSEDVSGSKITLSRKSKSP